jgi:hypothetical protein
VESSERYADGQADLKELQGATERARAWLGGSHLAAGAWVANRDVWEAVFWEADVNGRRVAAGWHTGHLPDPLPDAGLFSARLAEEQKTQCGLLRDLFGPLPFREVRIDPSVLLWSRGAVVQLARAAYEERLMLFGHLDPARLAVLADALEESGCATPEILLHLRGPGPHVRGCFVLDALLGRG